MKTFSCVTRQPIYEPPWKKTSSLFLKRPILKISTSSCCKTCSCSGHHSWEEAVNLQTTRSCDRTILMLFCLTPHSEVVTLRSRATVEPDITHMVAFYRTWMHKTTWNNASRQCRIAVSQYSTNQANVARSVPLNVFSQQTLQRNLLPLGKRCFCTECPGRLN